MPAVGEKLEFKGLQFEVLDADRKRVNRVRLRVVDEPGAGLAGSQARGE
jgi:CBS domain containing-hemolysin-like protein